MRNDISAKGPGPIGYVYKEKKKLGLQESFR
jgi:hypothetical protein